MRTPIVYLTGTAREIADWLAERWVGRDGTYLHVDYRVRDAATPAEWMNALGHWPTMSVMGGDGCASRDDGVAIELYRIKVVDE